MVLDLHQWLSYIQLFLNEISNFVPILGGHFSLPGSRSSTYESEMLVFMNKPNQLVLIEHFLSI